MAKKFDLEKRLEIVALFEERKCDELEITCNTTFAKLVDIVQLRNYCIITDLEALTEQGMTKYKAVNILCESELYTNAFGVSLTCDVIRKIYQNKRENIFTSCK